jgi:hypothetical protein
MTLASPRRTAWIAAVSTAAVLAACSGNSEKADTTTAGDRQLTGTFTMTVLAGSTTPCAPVADRPDLTDGAPVVVLDANGNILATGSLGSGSVSGDACVRALQLPKVPRVDIYRVQIGAADPIEFSSSSLDENGDQLDLRLGV